jgi:hypothetical protein
MKATDGAEMHFGRDPRSERLQALSNVTVESNSNRDSHGLKLPTSSSCTSTKEGMSIDARAA